MPRKWKRPSVRVKRWIWRDAEQNEFPGVALLYRGKVVAHLTPDEASDLCNHIIDTIEQLEDRTVTP